MRIAIFGGSFDPVHGEHVEYVRAAVKQLGADKIIVVPSRVAPHKKDGASASAEDRLAMCKLAFRNIENAEISDYEITRGGTSYTYLTCAHFRKLYPEAELFLLVGADMLENFFSWKNPQSILSDATLAACGRGSAGTEKFHLQFLKIFGKDFLSLGFTGREVSSTEIRVALAFGKECGLDGEVLAYIKSRGLYCYPVIGRALALEKESRREHSYRVARMAVSRARSLGIAEEKALLASALHDCGKNVPLSSELLRGFAFPEGVPAPVPEPVAHQFTGAYLAENLFGIEDEEIVDAIRYHTTGRENMTPLGKLVYLSDLLEEGRQFPGVERLRKLFYEDLDACFAESIAEQTEYLLRRGEVYPLTLRACEWAKRALNDQK